LISQALTSIYPPWYDLRPWLWCLFTSGCCVHDLSHLPDFASTLPAFSAPNCTSNLCSCHRYRYSDTSRTIPSLMDVEMAKSRWSDDSHRARLSLSITNRDKTQNPYCQKV
jgi:hypothetical protein